MGKYSPYTTNVKGADKKQIHPIWRGIGFAMIILIPALAYGSTIWLLQENRNRGWVQIPPDLLIKAFPDQLILVKVIGAIIISLVLYALFNLISFIIISIFAPSRYGPYDVPPVQYRRQKK